MLPPIGGLIDKVYASETVDLSSNLGWVKPMIIKIDVYSFLA